MDVMHHLLRMTAMMVGAAIGYLLAEALFGETVPVWFAAALTAAVTYLLCQWEGRSE